MWAVVSSFSLTLHLTKTSSPINPKRTKCIPPYDDTIRMIQSSIRPDLYANRMLEFILKHTDYYEIMAQREAQKVLLLIACSACFWSLVMTWIIMHLGYVYNLSFVVLHFKLFVNTFLSAYIHTPYTYTYLLLLYLKSVGAQRSEPYLRHWPEPCTRQR
jgi:hypothetical protein